MDVGHATDYPDADKKRVGDIRLGRGPILHRGANINQVVEERLLAAAQVAGIELSDGRPSRPQRHRRVGDADRPRGVATGLVSVPLRYMHTPIEVMHLGDIEAAAALLAEFACALAPEVSFIPTL